jgi:hypothetical protein
MKQLERFRLVSRLDEPEKLDEELEGFVGQWQNEIAILSFCR